MKILKFGGTSVGSPERIRQLMNVVKPEERQIVVLSAVSGTTNSLVEISELYLKDENPSDKITALKGKYNNFIRELFNTDEFVEKGQQLINRHFETIASFSNGVFTTVHERVVLAQGELISTHLFHYHLQEIGIPSVLLPALEFMKTDENSEPDVPLIRERLMPLLEKHPDNNIFITQGFICRNSFGEIDNLKRGGSDYTASLIGAAIKADEVQIWTDIDGMHNNDPRIVENTKPISHLSFEEAAELAYFGAKILHPQSVFPAQKYKIPVRLLNTMEPNAHGTLINAERSEGEIKSVAAKDGITAIKIQSSRMLLAYGFLRKIFEVFERYKTSIDMITTSEVAVSVSIDNNQYVNDIINELKEYGNIEMEANHSIVCVVGDFVATKSGVAAKVLDSLKDIPLRMISYGGSNNNISILLQTDRKNDALKALHKGLF